MAAAGLFIWLLLLAGVFSGAFWLSIFDRLFLLAPWVVVPLSLSLVPARASRFPKFSGQMLEYFLFCSAALATLSFFHSSEPQSSGFDVHLAYGLSGISNRWFGAFFWIF